MKYVLKTTTPVEAIQYAYEPAVMARIANSWLVEAFFSGKLRFDPQVNRLYMDDVGMHPGDWIVRDANGKLSAVSNAEFRKLYTEAPND